MAAVTLDPTMKLRAGHQDGVVVVEEIPGLLSVFRDGHVERPQVVPLVSSSVAPELGVTSRDVTIDKFTNIWARFYVPKCNNNLPLLVYFHGGGFCVGSAAWSCYHDFLARLAARAGCAVVSVNYRLAPENKLPSAYEDGFKALMWVRQQGGRGGEQHWWSSRCDFGSVFLAGDSAGANIAYHIATRLGSSNMMSVKGAILIQPFFGGEARTGSERHAAQPARSALSLAASDAYWRLALPAGATRDHPWCNPLARNGSSSISAETRMLVCVSELDILKDRSLEFSAAMCREGRRVEHVMYKGVGHAFQVLSKTQQAQALTQDMMAHIKAFVHRSS